MRKDSFIARVDNIKFASYKSISNLQVSLGHGLNAIIGPGGSGKTNFLELLHSGLRFEYPANMDFQMQLDLVSDVNTPIIWKVDSPEVKGASKVLKLLEDSSQIIESLAINAKVIHKKIWKPRDLKGQKVMSSAMSVYHKTGIRHSTGFIQHQLPLNPVTLSIPGRISIAPPKSFRHFDIDGSMVFIKAYTLDILERLVKAQDLIDKKDFDGIRNLLNHSTLSSIREQLFKYSPFTGIRVCPDVHIYKIKEELIITNLYFEFEHQGAWKRWDELSDSCKRIFQIISTLCSHEGGVFLLETPELGLDPEQFIQLYNFLHDQAKSKQVILSTHTPLVFETISGYPPSTIFACRFNGTGTQIEKIQGAERTKVKQKESSLDRFNYLFQ